MRVMSNNRIKKQVNESPKQEQPKADQRLQVTLANAPIIQVQLLSLINSHLAMLVTEIKKFNLSYIEANKKG